MKTRVEYLYILLHIIYSMQVIEYTKCNEKYEFNFAQKYAGANE